MKIVESACTALLSSAVFLLCLLLLSCSSGATNQPNTAVPDSSNSPSENPGGTADAAKEIIRIQQSPTPPGIEDEMYEVLKAALITSLRTTSSGKLASIPPDGAANQVKDLYLIEDAGQFNLEWTYLNNGDTDRNSEVNIGDLTPIGVYYNARVGDPNWGEARVADCDGNGEVNISDVTRLGVNYLAQCDGYRIYGSDAMEGPWTELGTESYGGAGGPGPVPMKHKLTADDYMYYRIVPFDGIGDEGIPSLPAVQTHPPVIPDLGNYVEELIVPIGPEGGQLEGSPDALLNGVKVMLYPGALPAVQSVRLGYFDGEINFGRWGRQFGPLVDVRFDESPEVRLPMEIHIPYERADWDKVLAGVRVDDMGRFHLLGPMELSKELQFGSLTTFSPGTYAVFDIEPEALLTDHPWGTGFLPENDGFVIYNTGSTYSPGGECAGMSSFALWYYENKKWTGDFYGQFTFAVGDPGDNLTAEHLIKTRAHNSIDQQYGAYCEDYLWFRQQSDWYNFMVIRGFMAISQSPVMIDLATQETDIGSGIHSVLAYGFDDHGLWFYDPNVPATLSYCDWSGSSLFDTSGTLVYGGFDRVAYWGGGSLHVTESYESIYGDAINGFTDTGVAEVVVTSHANGVEVSTGQTTISGSIHSADLLVDRLKAYTAGQFFETSVPESGAFSVSIPIQAGENNIFFFLYGTDAGNPSPVFVVHDKLFQPLELTGNPFPAKISVVLTWSKDDTDLDLYVIDPTGDYSYYGKHNTADGGELSIDDADGYGPEYWSLRSNDTIRYGQEYRIRAHYFDDRGHGGQILIFKVVTEEGTSNQLTHTEFRYLSTSNQMNTGHLDTGPDWVDAAVVIPVNHGTSSLRVEESEDGVPRIYVPVR